MLLGINKKLDVSSLTILISNQAHTYLENPCFRYRPSKQASNTITTTTTTMCHKHVLEVTLAKLPSPQTTHFSSHSARCPNSTNPTSLNNLSHRIRPRMSSQLHSRLTQTRPRPTAAYTGSDRLFGARMRPDPAVACGAQRSDGLKTSAEVASGADMVIAASPLVS
jgi:hypothetical protein